MSQAQWFVFDVNPYPWKVPPFSVGRSNGKVYPRAGRDEGLHTYKEAIREQLETMDYKSIEGPVALFLWFWRNIPEYDSAQGRRVRKHEADTTNLLKATEDAFQNYLYKNDINVTFIQSYRVEQSPSSPSLLVACVYPFEMIQPVFPDAIQSRVDELINRYPSVTDNSFDSDDPIPF